MKKYFLTLMVAVFSMTLFAQKSENKTIVIQTNAVCETCEKLFAEKVPYFKGVTDYSFDLKTAKMTVTYNPKKTTPEEIRKGVSDLGYNADDVKADAKAREKLPACCKAEKKNTCPHSHGGKPCGGHKH